MATDTPDYYLYCESCDFCQHVEKVLHRTPLTSVDELVANVSRFHCSVCGAKKVIIKEKKDVSALDW